MVKIEVNVEQLQEAIDRLPARDQIRLLKKLQRKSWAKRIQNILKRIDQRRKKHPISQEEITKEVMAVRKQIYAKSNH